MVSARDFDSILERMGEEDLTKAQGKIEAKLKLIQEKRREDATRQIRELADKVGLSMAELLRLSGASGRGALPAKFHHPKDKSITWSGRGGKPNWMREWEKSGKSPNDLLINKK